MNWTVYVTPGASRINVRVLSDDALKVHLTAAPEHGKANKQLVRVLADHFGIRKSTIHIKIGHTSPIKIVEIQQDL